MQKTYVEAQQALEVESQELKSLEAENIKIADVIDASNNALADAKEQLEKAEAMIKRANLLMSRAGPVRAEETARLEQLSAQSDQVLKLEAEKVAMRKCRLAWLSWQLLTRKI